MQVHVHILFEEPTEDDWQAMRSLANSLTDNRDSVRVSAGTKPKWLVAEFTMPTEAQYKAVPKIDWAIRCYADNRWDSAIAFPYTAAERERAARKAARRRELRAARRARLKQNEPEA